MLKNALEKKTNMFIYLLRLVQEVAVNYPNHDKRLPAVLSVGGLTTASIKKKEITIHLAWRTLLVYTSVTPCLMHDSRTRKGTVFVPKHGKKTCKGTD